MIKYESNMKASRSRGQWVLMEPIVCVPATDGVNVDKQSENQGRSREGHNQSVTIAWGSCDGRLEVCDEYMYEYLMSMHVRDSAHTKPWIFTILTTDNKRIFCSPS